MPRQESNNSVNNNKDTMIPLESSNATTVGPEKCHIAKPQNGDLKWAFANMIDVLKAEIKKSHKESCKSTNKW